jgi:hypothetical protein
VEEQLHQEFEALGSALAERAPRDPSQWTGQAPDAASLCLALEEVRRAWEDLRRAPHVSKKAGQMMTPLWTLRDLVSHVASWAQEFRREAELSLQGTTIDYEIYFEPGVGPTEWNHARVAERRKQKWDEILGEIDSETRRLQELLLSAPAERLHAVAKFAPVVAADRRPLVRNLAEVAAARCFHDRHHLGRIAARRAQLAGKTKFSARESSSGRI